MDLVKAKLIEADMEWKKFLLDKELIVGRAGERYHLVGFDGDMNELCKVAWENKGEEHEYESLKELQMAVQLGNHGFGFAAKEIEILALIKLENTDGKLH
ncbi:hypothetical protein [Clostridium aminobutyricum]|uniref:Uncharacterized protein n=1 Tax=Clostridium aminobutyricum TaxID=33953 RepID=A0A939D9C4_CLOAM|nr:hypothetical protein [Clostridium aminobutyricum]MBN7773829.1 hypothetical protein [Clostridium aminobutyricum]